MPVQAGPQVPPSYGFPWPVTFLVGRLKSTCENYKLSYETYIKTFFIMFFFFFMVSCLTFATLSLLPTITSKLTFLAQHHFPLNHYLNSVFHLEFKAVVPFLKQPTIVAPQQQHFCPCSLSWCFESSFFIIAQHLAVTTGVARIIRRYL